MKSKLEEILNDVSGKFENNEVAGINAIGEYYTNYAVQDFNKIENPENIANIVNENLGTDFEKEDIEKIGKIVEAEMNNEIEPVGWDEENNKVDMDKINKIYEENKEVLDKAENPFVENVENENKEKTENTKIEEDKQSIIKDIAEDAFSEMTDNLKNSENVFDSAVGEMYDRWREEYLEQKEAEKEQEIEEAYNEGEKENEQESDKNIEETAQQEGQKEQQSEGEFAEAQAREAAEMEMDAGMSM